MKQITRLTVAATTVVLAVAALPSAAAGQAAGDADEKKGPSTAEAQPFEGFAPGGGLRSGDTLLASSFRRTCAVQPDARVTCWGDEGTRERLSAAVLEDVLAVSIGDSIAGRFHTCALHGRGTVSCWGPGGKGQLGTGRTTDRYRPVKVLGLRDAVAIAAGADHTCAVRRYGRVVCWGDGSFGQLGDGSTESSLVPQAVPGLSGVTTIAAGSHGNCAVHTDGGVSCWGWGVATTDGHLSPRRISLPEDVVSVAVGWGRTCAVAASGRLHCWAFANAVRPALVTGIRDAVAVSAGDRSFCVLHAGGGVSCWGENNSAGQLGVGTTDPQPEPVRLDGIADAVAVTVSTQSAVGAGARLRNAPRRFGVLLGRQRVRPTRRRHLRAAASSPTTVQEFRGFEPGNVPVNPTGFVRTWIDRFVEEREADFPWLRTAWDHIRDRTYFVPHLGYGGLAGYVCHGRGVFQVCSGRPRGGEVDATRNAHPRTRPRVRLHAAACDLAEGVGRGAAVLRREASGTATRGAGSVRAWSCSPTPCSIW